MKFTGKITKVTGLVCIVLAGYHSYSQNLVVNPAMNAKCVPPGYGQIIKTETWTNANGGTVDLYDKSMTKYMHKENGIPMNYMGYQYTTALDQNYAGIIAYYDDGNNKGTDSVNVLGFKDGYKKYTEYLQGELAEPLAAGKIYQVSFKVSLADKSGRAVSCLGALLTPNKLEEKSNTFLTQKPQFISHRVISDSSNWVTLYGAYVAEGGEKFITIGCFKDEYFQVEKMVGPMQNDSRKAYYYVTDVTVGPYIAKPNMDALIVGVDFIELMDLRFKTDSASIEPRYYNELDEVAQWMSKHPELRFFIAGYTDKTGSDAINDPLSLNRANAVKNYLVQKGVKENNLITEGYGSDDPIEDRIKSRKNRRVEIYLYSGGVATVR